MDDPHLFEEEVIRIARVRWPAAEFGGGEMHAGQERDGVFVTEDCIHLLEVTTSRTKEKAIKDLKKLYDLSCTYRRSHPEKAVKCWFITQHEPTADQRNCRKEIKGAAEGLFNILSLTQFQSKLVDSLEYLLAREKHNFGSIYDPKTGNAQTDIPYIEVGLRFADDDTHRSISDVADRLLSGDRCTLLGEYGVGKSMTLRELFRSLALSHRRKATSKFPIYLNLREHQSQTGPAEILERHARNIGFANPSQLVRAWKLGYVTMLLDGFDEVASSGLQGAWKRLRDARYSSMAGIRHLIRDSPETCGIAIAGRQHFFDTEDERKRAIGGTQGWSDIHLDEFTETQIASLVKQYNYTGDIPVWVPARPLLLATLFAQGFSSNTTKSLSDLTDPAVGWDFLLDEVCSREARIESSISGENIRAILESLATLARSKDSGIGPLSPTEIVSLFERECGFTPTDEALIVLQRLPGLGRDISAQDDSRLFVDVEFADACRGGEFINYCLSPFGVGHLQRLQSARHVIGPLGIALAASRLAEAGFNDGMLTAAVKGLGRDYGNDIGATPADLVQLSNKLSLAIQQRVEVRDLLVDALDIDDSCKGWSQVSFTDCYFHSVTLSPDLTSEQCPIFRDCLIQDVDGRISAADLPAECFVDCVIETFADSAGTTSSILDLQIPAGSRVLISILKKLFVQSLGGRRENALYRGLDGTHQSKVSAILGILKSSGIITQSGRGGEPIWIPVRRQRPRILAIIGSPSTSTDPIVVAARRV